MDRITEVQNEALSAIESAQSPEELQQVRIKYLGKKGSIQALMSEMKSLPKEEKPVFGQKVNLCKQAVSEAIEKAQAQLEAKALEAQLIKDKLDITLNGTKSEKGTMHPLHMIQQEIEDLFIGMGYKIAEGPEVEEDYYNFELANIPKDHPAREMQDTCYIDPNTL